MASKINLLGEKDVCNVVYFVTENQTALGVILKESVIQYFHFMMSLSEKSKY